MPSVNDKTKYYFLAGAIVFIFLFDFFLIMSPQLKALGTLGQNIAKLDKDIKDTNYNLERISLFKTEAERLQEKLFKIEKSVLSRQEVPLALDKISRIAAGVDVQIDQIMPLKDSESLALESAEGKYYALPIFVKAIGGYHNIGKFFNRLETDEIFMTIEDFEIMNNNLNPQKHILKMAITIFTLEKEK